MEVDGCYRIVSGVTVLSLHIYKVFIVERIATLHPHDQAFRLIGEIINFVLNKQTNKDLETQTVLSSQEMNAIDAHKISMGEVAKEI